MDARFNDLGSNLVGGPSVPPKSHSASVTTGAGVAVDLVAAEGNCFLVAMTGTITGTPSFAVQAEESDTSGGSYTNVPTGGAVTVAAANTTYVITFKRTKRFLKVKATLTGTTSLEMGVSVFSTKKAT